MAPTTAKRYAKLHLETIHIRVTSVSHPAFLSSHLDSDPMIQMLKAGGKIGCRWMQKNSGDVWQNGLTM